MRLNHLYIGNSNEPFLLFKHSAGSYRGACSAFVLVESNTKRLDTSIMYVLFANKNGGGREALLPEKLDGVCDTLPKSLSYLWPRSAIFPTLFTTWPKIQYLIYDRCSWCSYPEHNLCKPFDDFRINNEKKVVSFKNIPNSRLQYKTHTLFVSKTAAKQKGVTPRSNNQLLQRPNLVERNAL